MCGNNFVTTPKLMGFDVQLNFLIFETKNHFRSCEQASKQAYA